MPEPQSVPKSVPKSVPHSLVKVSKVKYPGISLHKVEKTKAVPDFSKDIRFAHLKDGR